jgi:hypothetical protein
MRVLDLLRSLGYKAERGVKIKGVRGKHQVDVAACFEFGGLCYSVIVECKYWNERVKKAQVAVLSSVVSDIGAEKGIIISTKGFQKGALELAKNSNIELLTFDQFAKKAGETMEKALRHQCFDLITSLSAPFYKFHSKMSDKAHKMREFWVPTAKGFTFLGGLAMFEMKLKDLDNKQFPCYYMDVPFHEREDEELERTEVNNKVEYLKLLLRNIEKWKKEAESDYNEIFSE